MRGETVDLAFHCLVHNEAEGGRRREKEALGSMVPAASNNSRICMPHITVARRGTVNTVVPAHQGRVEQGCLTSIPGTCSYSSMHASRPSTAPWHIVMVPIGLVIADWCLCIWLRLIECIEFTRCKGTVVLWC